ncbi:MAG: 4-hydroxy-3-methylbut-2-enyl diphosphate reductase [Candidatus Marinimicrobia bacterium]|jgi:4-hydroxy-3-methylbut-2-enyl diphosphate reductase|nr:4-hydroxy-3-methylbut-2-enyl diphosphate reductase [Candidatus Neomarinimicrobiota bacterium]MBT3630373.1 4-hydroxy-3-methylbut-2-enyl diphosphate reductase [Candidatus Neomarinimicrobiota bacterium]MBT3823693.1 4-hydroxy-3-methylbut-2-enyl diphosphate reductase [Candidatus Neomarinimicrobiota bacterium]MBT4131959.1 4-hydroxy-3-methylbut-2-enyl diphosphate reductase [Candidatus Neomarinimicrobiota bacterium]MBT4294684.1 4-hydroxy-3-methylbut-2-enyl diphosphate reductase [Candidatus Neomarini
MSDHLKIRVAKDAGFCFGVRDAIEKAREIAREHGKVYMLGDIVHNERVVNDLTKENVRVVDSLDDVTDAPVLFRAHGTTPELWEEAGRKDLAIVDATCPLVHEIHNEIKKLNDEARKLIIIGDHGHDEVIAIRAQVREAIIIASIAEAEALPRIKKAGIVSQSTQMIENVQEIIGILSMKIFDLRFVNTVCFPTRRNQGQIKELAPISDVMIIVGSFTSANTKRLHEVSLGLNPHSYMVESASDIKESWFDEAESAGVSAGASSPDDLIQEVVEHLSNLHVKSRV